MQIDRRPRVGMQITTTIKAKTIITTTGGSRISALTHQCGRAVALLQGRQHPEHDAEHAEPRATESEPQGVAVEAAAAAREGPGQQQRRGDARELVEQRRGGVQGIVTRRLEQESRT